MLPIGAAMAMMVVFICPDESLALCSSPLLPAFCRPGVIDAGCSETAAGTAAEATVEAAEDVAVTNVVGSAAGRLDEEILMLVVVAGSKPGLVEEMSEDTDSSNDVEEVEEVSAVVCCVVATGVTSEIDNWVSVVGVAGATVGVVATAGAGAVVRLVEVVTGAADVVVVVADVTAEVTVSVWPPTPKRPPTPFKRPPTTPPPAGGTAAIATKGKGD